jgi:UDP-N-acetylmuramyl tripeptide synthase
MISQKIENALCAQTITCNCGFDAVEIRRLVSQIICPSGRFHALNIVPPKERVRTSERKQAKN